MKLTIAEAATVLGKSDRQVRYQIRQGRLRAKKEGKTWQIASEDLPLDEHQRQELRERWDTAQETLKSALEPLAKAISSETAPETGRYSVRRLEAFSIGRDIYLEVAATLGTECPALPALFETVDLITQGCHVFHADEKAECFRLARRRAATAAVHLYFGDAASEALAERIEQTLIPKIGGLVAAQEKGGRRGRFERFGSQARGRS